MLEAMRTLQSVLVDLLMYEQTALAAAQRYSGLGNGTVLFSGVFNFRQSQGIDDFWSRSGMRVVEARERSNYPFSVLVDDSGSDFLLTVQTDSSAVEPERVLGYLSCAVQGLLEALEVEPGRPFLQLEVLPWSEREQLINEFNATQAAYPKDALIHELFEQQVERRSIRRTGFRTCSGTRR